MGPRKCPVLVLLTLSIACGSVSRQQDASSTDDANAVVDAVVSTPDAPVPDAPMPDAPVPDAGVPDAAPLTSCIPGSSHVCLTAIPDPSTVFDVAEHTYFFGNTLSNTVWHRPSNTIIGGAFSTNGYFQFDANACPFPSAPNLNTGDGTYGAMVQLPAVGLVVHTRNINPSPPGEIFVAPIAPTGMIGTFSAADFGGTPPVQCNVISSSWDELLCLQPPQILHFQGSPGSNVLTLTKIVTLSQPLNDECGEPCWGATFAFDGAYYYFPFDGNVDDSNITYATYQVYDTTGAYIDTYDSNDAVTTGGRLTSLYFDWSVGRYTVHDGYANYKAGTQHAPDCTLPVSGAFNDSQVYGPPSLNHQ